MNRDMEFEIVDPLEDTFRAGQHLMVRVGLWADVPVGPGAETVWAYVETVFDKRLAVETAERLLELASQLPDKEDPQYA